MSNTENDRAEQGGGDHHGVRERNRWYEYKVDATIEHAALESDPGERSHHAMESDWIKDRQVAINLAQELSDRGYSAEIRTRSYETYAPKDFEAIPNQGDA